MDAYIHLQSDEAYGYADCGCSLTDDNDGPAYRQCPLHAAAPDLLAAVEELWRVLHTTSQRPGDACFRQPRSTCDSVFCEGARAAIRKARGEEAIREDRAMTTREAIETALRERIIEPMEDA